MSSISSMSGASAIHAQNIAAMQQAAQTRQDAAAAEQQTPANKTTGAGGTEIARQQAVTRAQLASAVSPVEGQKRVAENNESIKPPTEQTFEAPGLKMKAEIARQARIEVRQAIESSFLQSMMEGATTASRDAAMEQGDAMARNRETMRSMEMPEASRAFRAEQEISTKRFEAQLAELRSMVLGQPGGGSMGMDMRA
ncbi:hypothetical protein ACQ5SO_09445 [Rhodovulum sp. DZ06]|uniref:hypothetical protein n=1 Tax=Rhodovulum sp. DZ06 TaxID=3425126 RepID=UPI003D348A4E